MNIRGIMILALPGFIAMAIVLALSHIPGWKAWMRSSSCCSKGCR